MQQIVSDEIQYLILLCTFKANDVIVNFAASWQFSKHHFFEQMLFLFC